MRIAAFTLVGALGLAVSAVSANAAPTIPALATPQASNIVQAAGGCGRGFHPNRSGRCVPIRYGYYRPHPGYVLAGLLGLLRGRRIRALEPAVAD
jgi:hypothetical protein